MLKMTSAARAHINPLTLVMMLMMSPSLIDSSSSFCASYGNRTLHCSRPVNQKSIKSLKLNRVGDLESQTAQESSDQQKVGKEKKHFDVT